MESHDAACDDGGACADRIGNAAILGKDARERLGGRLFFVCGLTHQADVSGNEPRDRDSVERTSNAMTTTDDRKPKSSRLSLSRRAFLRTSAGSAAA